MQNIYISPQPISDKIAQEICFRIASGIYQKGEKLPSVRSMAKSEGVSPDTVSRAYAQLEQLSLVEAKAGLGTFITENEEWILYFRYGLIMQKISAFKNDMQDLGMSLSDAVAYLLQAESTDENENGLLRIETMQEALAFLENFEKYAKPDELGGYSLTFANEADYALEKAFTTLRKSGGKYFYSSHGKTWLQLKASEIPKIVAFVMKHAEAISKAINCCEQEKR
ncbi:MAG: GntR family transcriptional regulator [Eubacteriaceae bacterium]|nr:GntR family transcriptional regulator [Eubacteriaceae bacterium]